MRAVLVGLVGAVLAVGGAQAAQCPITKRAFTVDRSVIKPPGGVLKPDLIGAPARVIRSAGSGKWDAVEAVIGGQHYAIRFQTASHATPSVTASSYSGSAAKSIDWRRHRDPTDIIGADILEGPLAGLTLGDGVCP